MRRLPIVLVILGMSGLAAMAQPSYYEVPDVPTDLVGVDYFPWTLVRNDAGAYSVAQGLPRRTPVDALHRLRNGNWLISVESMTSLSGVDWDPRDVFEVSAAGVAFPFPGFAGAVGMIPRGSNVDAVLLRAGIAGVIVSFDVPTTIAGNTYDPADLVVYNAAGFGPAPFFDGSAAGIPRTLNVTGADIRGGRIVISLDVPFGLPPFLPGELLAWDGISLSVLDPQPSWPADRSSRIDGLSFLADPGAVPELSVERIAGGLRLSWLGSTCGGGENYGIYQGTLGAWYSHVRIDCDDAAPFLQEDIPLPPGNAYFLVVPHNDVGNANPLGNDEGVYGTSLIAGVTAERPPAAAADACVVNQVLSCSP